MKQRFNFTLNPDVVSRAARLASRRKTSVSQLIDSYLERITTKFKGKDIIDIIEELPKPNIPADADLVKEYYEDKAKKYGI